MNTTVTESKQLRFVLIFGIIINAVLFFYAVYLFKERTVFLDASFHLFSILKEGDFAIQVNRFGAFFTQLFPLIGSKLNLSLTTIAVLYSVSFVLLNLIVFLIIAVGFRNSKMALAFLLYTILMTTNSFFWIQCELIQGISFAFLFFAYVEKIYQEEQLPMHSVIFLPLLIFLLVFFYPLMPFVVVFGLVYGALQNPGKRMRYIVTMISFVLMYYLKIKFFKNYYDTEAMLRLDNLYNLFPNYFGTRSFKDYITYFTRDYYFVPLAFFALTIQYLYKKVWMKLLLLAVSYIGFSILMIGTYPNGADQFYLEPQYSILAFFVVLPLSYELVPSIKSKTWGLVILAFIAIISLGRIWNTHDAYTARLNWFRNILNETGRASNQKIIISAQQVPLKTVLMTWGSSYEFWLLSTIEEKKSRSIIVEEKAGEFDYLLPGNKTFITKWGGFNYSELPKRYFIFSDTSAYQKY